MSLNLGAVSSGRIPELVILFATRVSWEGLLTMTYSQPYEKLAEVGRWAEKQRRELLESTGALVGQRFGCRPERRRVLMVGIFCCIAGG